MNKVLWLFRLVPLILCAQFTKKSTLSVQEEENKTRSNHDWVSGLLKRATSSIVIITHHVYENTYYRRSRTPPFVMKKVKSQFWAYFFSNFTNHFPFYKKRCSWYWWSADRDRQKWKKNDFVDERNNFKHETFVLQKNETPENCQMVSFTTRCKCCRKLLNESITLDVKLIFNELVSKSTDKILMCHLRSTLEQRTTTINYFLWSIMNIEHVETVFIPPVLTTRWHFYSRKCANFYTIYFQFVYFIHQNHF